MSLDLCFGGWVSVFLKLRFVGRWFYFEFLGGLFFIKGKGIFFY